jgi:hypothetical protein
MEIRRIIEKHACDRDGRCRCAEGSDGYTVVELLHQLFQDKVAPAIGALCGHADADCA